jgi:hypothetical protein
MCGPGENSSDVSLNGAGALDSRHDNCGDSGAINVTVIVDLKCTLRAVKGGGTAGGE